MQIRLEPIWRRLVVAGAMVAMAASVACERGCNDEPIPEGQQGAFELTEAIPADAGAVVFFHELRNLVTTLEVGTRVLPVESASVGGVDDWRAAGAKLDEPAAAYWRGGEWGVVGWADPERDIELADWTGDATRVDVAEPVQRGRQVDQGDRRRWIATDGRRLAAGSSPLQQTDENGGGESVVWPDRHEGWDVDTRLEDWAADPGGGGTDDAATPRMYGSIDAAGLVGGLQGEDRAGELLDQIVDRLERIYWRTGAESGDGSRIVELYTPGRGEVPSPVRDLGEARETLPDLGGLVRPGTPGVVRVSADPDQFVEMLRSTMEAGQRQQMDAMFETLRNDLQIDLETQLIDNITGQVAVVLFGIENAWFETEGLELVASTARLETTRQVVLVPFDDRDDVEALFDAFTQISMGTLRREAGEHTVQYAWFDDGMLEWAIIVGDDHLAFVDSIVASDHVRGWRESPRPLEGSFADHGVDSMLEATRGMGVYLDVDTIETMLTEGGDERRAQWLEAFDAIRLETDIGGRPEIAELQIWFDKPIGDEED